MIVCHCNVISKQNIRLAIGDILARDPGGDLSPQLIYRELEKRGRCCGCFPMVEKVVIEVLDEAMSLIKGEHALTAQATERESH